MTENKITEKFVHNEHYHPNPNTKAILISIKWQINRYSIVNPCNKLLFCHKKEWNADTLQHGQALKTCQVLWIQGELKGKWGECISLYMCMKFL